MKEKHLHVHLKDEQLLLHASGELAAASRAEVERHLELCAICRARGEKLPASLAEFGEVHQQALNAKLPVADRARTELKTRLAEFSEGKKNIRSANWKLAASRNALVASLVIAASLLLAVWLRPNKPQSIVALVHLEEPDVRLTPGATVPVTQRQVCGTEIPVPAVPAALQQKVFEQYGVPNPSADRYEVDYLITPELGGATDIRNLWPEPYQDFVWNAHVKDQLENRLHVMVCHGDIDLATAQRDISSDWIAAYRKYFHVDTPASNRS
jgi:hypothetical protein